MTIYFNHGFRNGLLAIRYPAATKLVIHATEPHDVSMRNRFKSILTMPATMGANVRIIGKNSPAVKANQPYLL